MNRARLTAALFTLLVVLPAVWLSLVGSDPVPTADPARNVLSDLPAPRPERVGAAAVGGEAIGAEVIGEEDAEGHEPKARPSEWFWRQRAYPHDDIKPEAIKLALAQAEAKETEARLLRAAGGKSALLNETWQQRGPTNVGARVTDLAVHPTDPDVVYAGIATGGVFKSVDGGNSWTPIFDDQAVLTVGAVALDPQQPETVYVGTGEANAISLSFYGVGMFKSTDGGENWTPSGLDETRYIARIVVDPTDSDRLYVAATGKLFGTGPNRGVYRSLDGGASWDRVFALTDSTACTDVAVDPQNPQTVYAVMWERVRGLTYRTSGGPSSSVWRSHDGGDNWHQLTGGLPTGPNVGRMGITVCASQPNVLYVIHADASAGFEGVYKSVDGGDTWSATNDWALNGIFSNFGWYFGNIRVDPTDPDAVYALGVPFYRTTDGGGSWNEVGQNMHVDHHALAFAPSQPARVYNGNDGGIYRSDNGGGNWVKLYDQPSQQFYAIEIDYQNPERLYGGTQDNGTLRTVSGGSDDWERIFGGDGFTTLVDPTDSDVIFAEYQYGNLYKSTNGGDWFDWSMNGIGDDRSNWSTPVVMDQANPNVMYFGTYRVYKSTDQGDLWNLVSGDLTGGDQGANFGTVTTLAIAPSSPTIVYAGTDDGRVWVYSPLFGDWNLISQALPNRWVTRVAVDPTSADIAYVTFSGLRWEDPISHVYRTADGGQSWQDISGDLPEAPVNVILVDPDYPETLYVGSDVGIYVSTDAGGSWQLLGQGLPRVPVLDLKFHQPTRTLAAGTHGRSMFTITAPGPTAVGDEPPQLARVALTNYPNPFNPLTTFAFALPREARVRLEIFDVRGERVALLLDEMRPAGAHEVRWDGRDDRRRDMPSGLYFARLAAGDQVTSRKLTLAR
jgi:photosystem II stability/assembly factor-like uncharacterized protein